MAQVLQLVEKVSLLAFLVGSMLAMGLSLGFGSVLAPLRKMRLVLMAVGLNFVLAPLLAWVITFVIPLQDGHAAGLMLLGGAAGAPFLPKLVEVAHGDVAVAVALVVLLTFGTILFLPFALPHLVAGFTADPWDVARPMVLTILVPLIAGMTMKSVAPSLAAAAVPVFAWLGNAGLLLLSVLLVALNIPALLAVVGSGAIAACILYVAGLFALAWPCGGRLPEARGVLALATSARNFGAAMVPAANSFRDPGVLLMLIVSAVVGLVMTFMAAGWVRRRTLLPHGN
jgi:predicted Na+-dependent transporter